MLYIGDTGVGKSVVVQKYLDDAASTDSFVAYTMKYSAQTKPTNLKVWEAFGSYCFPRFFGIYALLFGAFFLRRQMRCLW